MGVERSSNRSLTVAVTGPPRYYSCGVANILVGCGGSAAVRHQRRHVVVHSTVLRSASPEHRKVLADRQQERAQCVVLGATRQPTVALLQRETDRRETVDRENHQHPDGRVAAVDNRTLKF